MLRKMPYYKLLLFILLIVGCDVLQEEDVRGCTDATACNFNADANISVGCEYIVDDCGICGGNIFGTCNPPNKALLHTQELCESEGGFWELNCDNL